MEPKRGSNERALFRTLLEMIDLAAGSTRDEPEAHLAACCRRLDADLLYTVLPAENGWEKVCLGPDGERGRLPLPRPTGVVRHVLSRRASILQEKLTSPTTFHRHRDGWPEFETSSYLAVPIPRRGNVLGVLVLLRTKDREPFDLQDIPRAELVAESLAVRLGLKERLDDLQQLADTDEATRLPNERSARRILTREIRYARQHGERMAVVVVGISEGRSIKEVEGRWAGREILGRVGSVIVRSIRGADHVARFGDREFLVVLPRTDREGTERAALRIRQAVAADLSLGSSGHADGCSCAFACLPEDGIDERRLLSAVARRLFDARRGAESAGSEIGNGDRRAA